MADEMLSYREAQRELRLTDDELNDLVASGELRGFRDGDEIRFKRDDVQSLKKSRETEPTIVLSETEADSFGSLTDEEPIDLDAFSADETVLNIEGLLEDESEGTTPIPGSSMLDEDDLQIGEDTVLDTEELDLGDDFDLDDDTVGGRDTLIAGAGSRRVQMTRKESHTAMTVVLTLTMLLMLCPALILMNLMNGPSGTFPQWIDQSFLTTLNGLVEGVLGAF
ncbi:MAG: hypothetical protein AB7O52_02350 [Planctomycetota bacterium]